MSEVHEGLRQSQSIARLRSLRSRTPFSRETARNSRAFQSRPRGDSRDRSGACSGGENADRFSSANVFCASDATVSLVAWSSGPRAPAGASAVSPGRDNFAAEPRAQLPDHFCVRDRSGVQTLAGGGVRRRRAAAPRRAGQKNSAPVASSRTISSPAARTGL